MFTPLLDAPVAVVRVLTWMLVSDFLFCDGHGLVCRFLLFSLLAFQLIEGHVPPL